MRILVVIDEAQYRDQVEVGLRAFADLDVDFASGTAALEKAQARDYDAILIHWSASSSEGRELFEKLREENVDQEFLIAAHEQAIKKLREQRVRGRIFALLHDPIDAVEFFRAIGRLQSRQPARR